MPRPDCGLQLARVRPNSVTPPRSRWIRASIQSYSFSSVEWFTLVRLYTHRCRLFYPVRSILIKYQPITDLRSATPYTYTDIISFIGCPTDPTTASIWYTASVDGNTYTALNNPRVVVYTGASVITKTYAFPDLTVNTLKPEQTITVVPGSLTAGDIFQYLH